MKKMPKLSKEDAAALDLLLDRSPVASGKAGPVFASTAGASRERVRSAEKLLNLLQWMPGGDPPRDLVKNTLRRVGETADLAHMSMGPASLIAPSAQPHA